ncbi:MAG: GNAT family N-acetyltransferase [Rhodospirillales bacterium]|nr:GNAT family N-acetyltransferase [Rhodospirillales bacterium]
MSEHDPPGLAEATSAELSLRVALRPAPDEEALGRQWRELEARADCSFFQSWTYTGCLMAERFPDPILLEVHARDGPSGEETLVALALFNRRRGRFGAERLLLGESGIPSFDSVFIEHNGPLIARGLAPAVLPRLLHAALGQPIPPARVPAARRVVYMSGVDGKLLAAAHASRAATALGDTRIAPATDLAGLRRDGAAFLDRVSANTRYQLRRSARSFAASGPLSVCRAANAGCAHRWLEALAALHQETWEARGLPGAFADANFRRFHHALIDRGLPRREVDLLEVSAGARRLGYLLNFVFRGTVYAYQSGFAYRAAGRHEKPGLTCHHQAIEMYLGEGMDRYDFLGGAERYKTSLSDTATDLHWLLLAARWSAPGVLFRLKQSRDAIAAGVRGHAGRGV